MPIPATPIPARHALSHLATLTRLAGAMGAMAVLIAGCSSAPSPGPLTPPAGTTWTVPRTSSATSARDYRRDAAGHLYELNAHRIYKGRLPPMLYAVGVFQVDVDRQGQIVSTRWLRAPRHAPEVIAEIEQTVRRAAPFPSPARLGRVTYTDTWLWDKGGHFQLDTLTEGQD